MQMYVMLYFWIFEAVSSSRCRRDKGDVSYSYAIYRSYLINIFFTHLYVYTGYILRVGVYVRLRKFYNETMGFHLMYLVSDTQHYGISKELWKYRVVSVKQLVLSWPYSVGQPVLFAKYKN
jgi:hypothetical protein